MKLAFHVAILATLVGSFANAAQPSGLYKSVVDKIQALHQQYPGFTEIFSIGQNDDGVDIYAMRISVTPKASDPKKIGHVFVSTHHGNEQKSTDFTLNFVQMLLKKYSGRDLFRGSLAETEWVVIPVLNISGYNANNRYEHGQDPNRDYPGICSHSTGGHLKSIRLMMDVLKSRIFTGSLTVHGYIGALTYPWGVDVDNTHTADHNAFDSITAKAAQKNGYRYGTSTDVVYPCEGAYEDYSYWKHGAWSLLLELKDGSQQDIADTTEAIWTYFDGLDSSPSVHHEFTAHCQRSGKPDLHNE